MKNVLIHPAAIIETLNIGEGSKIWAFVHILENVVIGRNCNICDHCFIESGACIGDNVTVKCGVWIWDGVKIFNNVFIGPNVTFTNDLYPRSKNSNFIKKETILEEGCSIGANSTLLAGVKIGKYSMVGAGSVVSKNVGDYELVFGVPAQKKGYLCVCGHKMIFDQDTYTCECGLSYKKEKDIVFLTKKNL